MKDYEISNFRAGEVSPRLFAQTDSQDYKYSCKTIKNFIVAPQGILLRRPGTKNMGTIDAIRIESFVSKEGLQYIIAFGNLKITVYNPDCTIATGIGTNGVLTTIWPTAAIPNIQFAYDNDVMYLVHKDYKPQVLTYTNSPSMAITDYSPTFSGDTSSWQQKDFTSSAGKYPSAVAIYISRLFLAASGDNVNYIWASDVRDYNTFNVDIPVVAANAIETSISDNNAPAILWLKGDRGLIVGTTRGIYTIGDDTNIISPTGEANVKINSMYPANKIPIVMLGSNMIYVQEGNRKIRIASYNKDQDKYLAPDLTIISEHITNGLISEIDVQTEPETFLWSVTEDGKTLLFTLSTENHVTAWSKFDYNFDVKSLCIVKDGLETTPVMIVSFKGANYLLRMDKLEYSNGDYHFIDFYRTLTDSRDIDISSVTWSASSVNVETSSSHNLSDGDYIQIVGTGISGIDYGDFMVGVVDATNITLLDEISGLPVIYDQFTDSTGKGSVYGIFDKLTGLTEYEGDTLQVVSQGVSIGDYKVVSGEIDLPKKRHVFSFGYGYSSDVVPLGIKDKKNKLKRVVAIRVEVYESLGGKSGSDENNLDNFSYERHIIMDNPQKLFSGIVRIPHRANHNYNGDILVRQDDPLPFTLLSIIAEMEG